MRLNYSRLVSKIARILTGARVNVIRQINHGHVLACWKIGREIVEFEQKGKKRGVYGERLIERLSKDMIQRFGRGFSPANLKMMRLLYQKFPIRQTVSDESKAILSWSHYCELLKIDDPASRSFYEQESVQNNWSVRELKRQINSMLFERLALSKDAKTIAKMARKGHVIEKPEDAIKDPYILEFLNLKEETYYTERQLEQALIDKLKYLLLELGKGFVLVARQKRITVSNRHYYIDLVFYNRLLKCFVLIDLKTGELDHSDIEQMNFYLNYFKGNEKIKGENDPIGLILCARKNSVFAKYVLGGLNNKIFASKYKLALPSEQKLKTTLKLSRDRGGVR